MSLDDSINRIRSSSASHLSENYRDETLDDETVKWKFHGVDLNNDLSKATKEELSCLIILVLFLIFKNRILGKAKGNSWALWASVLAMSIPLVDVVWIPLLSTILYTRTSYPYLVVIPHCIVACCNYRHELEQRSLKLYLLKEKAQDDANRQMKPHVHPLSSFAWSFLCNGFGGSIVSDWLLGLPITALGHSRIIPCYVVSYLLVWYSPLDWCYQEFMDTSSFWRFALCIGEAVDSVTTPPGRISRGAKELKNQVTAPLAAGMLAGIGGGWIRYSERTVIQGLKGEDPVTGPSIRALESGFWNTLFHSVLWWYHAVYVCTKTGWFNENTEEALTDRDHCDSFSGTDDLRFGLVLTAILWTTLKHIGVISASTKHPFVWWGQDVIAPTFRQIAKVLSLGPQYGVQDRDTQRWRNKKKKKKLTKKD